MKGLKACTIFLEVLETQNTIPMTYVKAYYTTFGKRVISDSYHGLF